MVCQKYSLTAWENEEQQKFSQTKMNKAEKESLISKQDLGINSSSWWREGSLAQVFWDDP